MVGSVLVATSISIVAASTLLVLSTYNQIFVNICNQNTFINFIARMWFKFKTYLQSDKHNSLLHRNIFITSNTLEVAAAASVVSVSARCLARWPGISDWRTNLPHTPHFSTPSILHLDIACEWSIDEPDCSSGMPGEAPLRLVGLDDLVVVQGVAEPPDQRFPVVDGEFLAELREHNRVTLLS